MSKLELMTPEIQGYLGVSPTIKKVTFEIRDKITIHLTDGRILIAPLSRFPSIRKLSEAQRKKYTIGDGVVLNFHDADEIFHIQDFFGVPEDYIVK